MTPERLQEHLDQYRMARRHPLMPASVGEALDAIPELVAEVERLNDALAFGRKAASDAAYDRDSELAGLAAEVERLVDEANDTVREKDERIEALECENARLRELLEQAREYIRPHEREILDPIDAILYPE